MTRAYRSAAVLAAAVVLLSGCSSDSDDRMEEAAVAARTYQEAVLAEDWPTACELKTDRMRGGETIAECAERSENFPERRATPGEVTTGEPFEIEAVGEYPAGVGVGVSYDYTSGESSGTVHNAVRVVEDDEGTWRVDQATDLDGEPSQDAVRDALSRE